MQFSSLIQIDFRIEKFGDDFAIFEGARRQGKAWIEFSEANQDKTIIKQQELDDANRIINNAMKNKFYVICLRTIIEK